MFASAAYFESRPPDAACSSAAYFAQVPSETAASAQEAAVVAAEELVA